MATCVSNVLAFAFGEYFFVYGYDVSNIYMDFNLLSFDSHRYNSNSTQIFVSFVERLRSLMKERSDGQGRKGSCARREIKGHGYAR